MEYIVSKDNSGKRLDFFLSQNTESYIGRNIIKKIIKSSEVLIDNKIILKPSFILEEGMKIFFNCNITPKKNYDVLAENIDLDIIFENNDFLVISKKSGMCTHPDQNYSSGTVVNAVAGYLKNHKTIFKNNDFRLGIVHRLDKDTSGCLMIAKTIEMQQYLSKIIAERKIIKNYYALVIGRFNLKEGTIDSPLARDPNNREKMITTENHLSKNALTYFEVIEEFKTPSCSLVKVNIITGRTHQIRAHFTAIGHPVICDDLYGNKKENLVFQHKLGLKRMFLHAYSLEIPLKTKEVINIKSELPKDLDCILDKLRKL
jgi:23S rRNA pseudouridine1911/1915/1917 synthase